MSTSTIPAATVLKNAKKGPLAQSASKSSNECSVSSTTPNTAINTAPPATKAVPITDAEPNTSPKMSRASRALKMSETAPRGARMTIGKVSSWNIVEKMLEVM